MFKKLQTHRHKDKSIYLGKSQILAYHTFPNLKSGKFLENLLMINDKVQIF